MGKSWFSGFGAATWQSLLGDGATSSWADFVSLWHTRFAATVPLELKTGAAEQAAGIPHSAAESTATAQSAGEPQNAEHSAAADPVAAFNALIDESGRFGTIFSYDFSEKAMAKLTGTDALDRGIWHGALSATTFEADIAHALGDKLTPGHGLFYTPDTGDFAGQAFLIVDANGQAGFQAGEDMVFELMPVYLHWGDIHAVTPLDQLVAAPHVG